MRFCSFVGHSISIAIRVATKCLPERLTGYIGTIVNDVLQSSSRSPPPKFYSSLYDDLVSYDPAQDPYLRAFYGDGYAGSRKQAHAPRFTSSSHRAERIFNELLPAPPIPVPARRESSKNVAKQRNARLIKAKKREAVRLCSSPDRFSALLASNIPSKDKKAIVRLTKIAVKEKFLSKRFSGKPFSQNHSDQMAELAEISTLPTLERFSTTIGLHGATTLGRGIRMDGLSYGRRRGVSGKPTRVPAVPPMINHVTEVALESSLQHRKVMSVVQACLPVGYMAPRATHNPRLVVRTGREDWGRTVQ
ncbi:hypothetical protein FRC03_010638 [Tulasnella sp. 419]|nr:hypothetical protein FRC03_010638 [Tulasnella sp. 419]